MSLWFNAVNRGFYKLISDHAVMEKIICHTFKVSDIIIAKFFFPHLIREPYEDYETTFLS